ncbi:MAG: hypothetical protein ACI9SQ_000689 [Rubritalea sp.]|jgi:hypothetical protein
MSIKHFPLLTLFTLISSNLLNAEQSIPKDENFKIETISEGFEDAMEVAITKDGRAFIFERRGEDKTLPPDYSKDRHGG